MTVPGRVIGERKDAFVPLLSQALRDDGLRLTRSRLTILRAVSEADGPFTAAELCESASSIDAGIGRASVFRVLQLLRDRGFVERLHSEDAEHYTLCMERRHHHHATCTMCGRTEPLVLGDDAERALRKAAERIGYKLLEHVLEARGICADCRSKGSGEK